MKFQTCEEEKHLHKIGKTKAGSQRYRCYACRTSHTPEKKPGIPCKCTTESHPSVFGRYAVSEGKTDTYSVEGDNAELFHHLARLAPTSRCFSRHAYDLACAVRLFVFYFNQRQLQKNLYPKYIYHLSDFVYSPFGHSREFEYGSSIFIRSIMLRNISVEQMSPDEERPWAKRFDY